MPKDMKLARRIRKARDISNDPEDALEDHEEDAETEAIILHED